jgi:hypothetical protein
MLLGFHANRHASMRRSKTYQFSMRPVVCRTYPSDLPLPCGSTEPYQCVPPRCEEETLRSSVSDLFPARNVWFPWPPPFFMSATRGIIESNLAEASTVEIESFQSATRWGLHTHIFYSSYTTRDISPKPGKNVLICLQCSNNSKESVTRTIQIQIKLFKKINQIASPHLLESTIGDAKPKCRISKRIITWLLSVPRDKGTHSTQPSLTTKAGSILENQLWVKGQFRYPLLSFASTRATLKGGL